uniref:Uncharacterized protein n=1 Tax=Arundo donax TaxID=35708 RepID=A0A0A9F6Q2_ARUDO
MIKEGFHEEFKTSDRCTHAGRSVLLLGHNIRRITLSLVLENWSHKKCDLGIIILRLYAFS